MKKTKYQTQDTRRKTQDKKHGIGFTIAELLIALSVMALLLVAVAVAFNASVTNYRENEEIFKTINNARQALFRMTTQLRTANAVDPNTPDNECALITSAGENVTYQFSDTNNKLYLIDNSTSDSYVLCNNVTAITFTKNTEIDGPTVYVKSVQISMTVQSGDLQKTLSAAAVIRKNLQQ
jgi:type II secretory pathway component PulJ